MTSHDLQYGALGAVIGFTKLLDILSTVHCTVGSNCKAIADARFIIVICSERDGENPANP
jgi:hypothetical protein